MKSQPEWRQGRAGELAVMRWLTKQGFAVAPTSFIEIDGAPRLIDASDGTILPDFLAVAAGHSLWVECKTYATATPWWPVKKGQGKPRFRHGIPLRLWEEYLKVEQLTGIPGALAILEKTAQAVCFQTFDVLKRTIAQRYIGQNMRSGPQVFWYVDVFQMYPLSSLETATIEFMAPEAERARLAPAPTERQLSLLMEERQAPAEWLRLQNGDEK